MLPVPTTLCVTIPEMARGKKTPKTKKKKILCQFTVLFQLVRPGTDTSIHPSVSQQSGHPVPTAESVTHDGVSESSVWRERDTKRGLVTAVGPD